MTCGWVSSITTFVPCAACFSLMLLLSGLRLVSAWWFLSLWPARVSSHLCCTTSRQCVVWFSCWGAHPAWLGVARRLVSAWWFLSLWCPRPAWLGWAVWVQEASATVPVLMIATTGADPSKDLEEFAGRTVGKAAYSELAMGGGQQVRPPPYTPSPSILP